MSCCKGGESDGSYPANGSGYAENGEKTHAKDCKCSQSRLRRLEVPSYFSHAQYPPAVLRLLALRRADGRVAKVGNAEQALAGRPLDDEHASLGHGFNTYLGVAAVKRAVLFRSSWKNTSVNETSECTAH